MIETIHHVALAVRDLERSVAFYGAQLGGRLVVRRRLEPGGYFSRALGDAAAGASIAVLRLGSATLELIQWDHPATPPTGGAHLCLLVPCVADELARLAGAGIRPLAPAQRIEEGPNVGGWIAWIQDPDGHHLELLELTPERRAARGFAAAGSETGASADAPRLTTRNEDVPDRGTDGQMQRTHMKTAHRIIRIFRTTIHPEMRQDFERDFASISVAAVKSQPGCISCHIGSPTRWNPDEYAMITVWEDEDALASLAGEEWHQAVIPPAMEQYRVASSVEHFYIREMANNTDPRGGL